MRSYLVATLGFACIVLSGCSPSPNAYACASSNMCVDPQQGMCEATGYCSFPDALCRDGRRYAEFAGPYANQCVGEGADGGMPDTTSCGSGALPNDRDCDGITDGQDNCADITNANQDNEDGDRFGDACDPCPPVADDNPPDTDSDDVANACDPNPNTPGDSIYLFEGFNRNVPSSWDKSGMWMVGNGTASSTPGGNESARLAVIGPATGKETTSASITITAAGASPSQVSVIAQNMVNGDSGVGCQVDDTGGTKTLRLGVNGAAGSISQAAYELNANETYVVETRRTGTTYTCRAVNGAAMQTVSGSSAMTNTPSEVGIRIFSVGARVQWLMSVSSP